MKSKIFAILGVIVVSAMILAIVVFGVLNKKEPDANFGDGGNIQIPYYPCRDYNNTEKLKKRIDDLEKQNQKLENRLITVEKKLGL